MKVLAKDAKAGQWYRRENGDRVLCLETSTAWDREDGVRDLYPDHNLTHLPDCTGWDWQPPKPKKKYREFVTFGEWWPHRHRWVQHNQHVHLNYWASQDDAKKWFDEGAVFLRDDGGDGEPFGVEVSE